jgi:hypothetical protein
MAAVNNAVGSGGNKRPWRTSRCLHANDWRPIKQITERAMRFGDIISD